MSVMDTSRPLREYRTLRDIRDRLVVLYEKADRIERYNESLDPEVLDEKQQAILDKYRCHGKRFPGDVSRMLRRTIDVLEARRVCRERRNRRRNERRRAA